QSLTFYSRGQTCCIVNLCLFFFSSRRRHTRFSRDWSSDVCSSDLTLTLAVMARTRLLYRLRDANARPWIHPAAGLLTLAALARILPIPLGIEPAPWLLAAVACWCLAYLLLLALLWQTRGTFTHPAESRSRHP